MYSRVVWPPVVAGCAPKTRISRHALWRKQHSKPRPTCRHNPNTRHRQEIRIYRSTPIKILNKHNRCGRNVVKHIIPHIFFTLGTSMYSAMKHSLWLTRYMTSSRISWFLSVWCETNLATASNNGRSKFEHINLKTFFFCQIIVIYHRKTLIITDPYG